MPYFSFPVSSVKHAEALNILHSFCFPNKFTNPIPLLLCVSQVNGIIFHLAIACFDISFVFVEREGILLFSLIYKEDNIHIYTLVLGQKRKQS